MEGLKIYDGVRKGRALVMCNICLNIVTRYFFWKESVKIIWRANESQRIRFMRPHTKNATLAIDVKVLSA